MTNILIVIISLIAAVLLVLFTVYFKKVFFLYFLVFVPCYGLFLEVLSGFTPLATSTVVTATKDYVWIFILFSFVLRQLIKPDVCRLPAAIGVWIFLYVLYGLATISMSISNIGFTGLALGVRNSYMYIPAMFIAASLIKEEKDIRALLRRFRSIIIAIGLYAIVQMVFGIESSFNVLRDRADLKTVTTSTFLSYIELSYFSCISLALLVAGFKWLPGKVLSVIGLGLAVFCVVACQSRTGLIVLMLVLVPFAFTRARIFAGIFFITAIAGISLVIFNPEFFYMHRLLKEALTTQRLTDWPTIFPRLFEHPILGYGLGSFGPAAWKAVQMEQATVSQAYYMDSFFLTTLLNIGFLGLGLFILLLSKVFIFTRRAGKRLNNPHSMNFVSGVKAVLLINLLYSIFFNMIDGFPGGLYFWFFIGAACGVYSAARGNEVCELPAEKIATSMATI